MSKYKYIIISNAIQLMVKWCCKNNNKKDHMILVKTQGILNNYFNSNKSNYLNKEFKKWKFLKY